MKESTKNLVFGVLGLTGACVAASASAQMIRNSNASGSTKLIAATAVAASTMCAADKAMDIYLNGIQQKKIEKEIEEKIKQEIEK